jgi:CheY-specific phosphatase CheX
LHYISEFIRAGTQEIYANMVNLPIEPVEGDDTVLPPVTPGGMTASIQFTGGLQAAIHMTYDEASAKNVTFTMMGTMPASVAAPEVGDVLGELANMIAGNFKAKMATKGLVGNATAPTITPNATFAPTPIPGGVTRFNRLKIPAASGELEIRIFAKI